VIKPLTMSCRSSVARALARLGVQDEAGVPYTAPATVYMCCTSIRRKDDEDEYHKWVRVCG
jgi:hypothetical protein